MEEIDSDDEWILEVEDPVLLGDLSWLEEDLFEVDAIRNVPIECYEQSLSTRVPIHVETLEDPILDESSSGVVGDVGNGVDGKGGKVAFGEVGVVGSVGKGFEGNGGNVALGSVGIEGNGGRVALGSVGAEGSGGNAVLGREEIAGTTGSAGGGAAAVSKRWRAAWFIWVLESDKTATKDRTKNCLGRVIIEINGAAKANIIYKNGVSCYEEKTVLHWFL